MTESLQSRLLHAEEDFLTAFTNGPSALHVFDQSWLQLQAEIADARNPLDEETCALAHTTAQRIVLLSDLFLDHQERSEESTARFLDELDSLFAQISLDLPPPAASTGSKYAPYIKHSYEWLLANLHNPYPSKRVRDSIAHETSTSRKDIDNWFVDARKRIGWTSLKKSYFSNKRSDIVDASTRFFVEADPKRPLPNGINVAFANILDIASELYSTKFDTAPLASTFDLVFRDMTSQLQATRQEEGVLARRAPGPSLSPCTSPLSSSPNCAGAGPTKSYISPLKRSRFPFEHERGLKRLRLNSFGSPNSLPSELPLHDQILLDPPLATTSSSAALTTNRKRRLSESDISFGPKRPRNSPVEPRLHAISNPFPMPIVAAEAVVDEWLKFSSTDSNVPSVTIGAPDLSEPIEIALFDFSTLISPYTYTSPSETSSNSTPITPNQPLPNTNVERPLPTDKILTTNLDVPSLQTNSEHPSYDFVSFDFEQDDFSFLNYPMVPQCLPTDAASLPLTTFNQPQPTLPPTLPSPWDWLSPELSLINSTQQSWGILPDMFHEVQPVAAI